MKKLVTIFSLIILAFVGVMISGCGDKYEKLSLSISTSVAPQNGVITLIIGDNELGNMEITANVNNAPKNFNYKSSFVSLMGKVAVSSLVEDVDKGSKVTITPIYPGEDTIAITTSEGNKVEYVRVRVIKRATSINFASEDISLVRGSTTENFAQYIEVEDSDSNETLINNFTYKFMLSQNIELSEEQSRQITIDSAGNLYISNEFERSSFVVKAMLGNLETQFKTINVLSQVENVSIDDYATGDIVDLYTNDDTMYYKSFEVSAESDSKIILDYDNLGEGNNKWFTISSELQSSGPYYTWNVKISAVKNVASAINEIIYPLQLRFVYAGNNQVANSTIINLRSSSAPDNYIINNINSSDNSIDIYSNDEVGVSYFSLSYYNQTEILKNNQSFKLLYDSSQIILYNKINDKGEYVAISEALPDTRIYVKAVGLTLGAMAKIKIVPEFYDGQDAYTKTITARYSSGVTEINNLKLSGNGVYPKTEEGTTTYYINLDEATAEEAKIGLNYTVKPDGASKKTIYIKSSNNNIVYGDVDDEGDITIYPSQVGEVTLTVGTSNIVGGAEKSINVVVYRKIDDFTFNITGDNVKYIDDIYYVKDNTISQMAVNVTPLDARYSASYKVIFNSDNPGISINGNTASEITIDNGKINSLNITDTDGIVEGTIHVTVTDQHGEKTEKDFNVKFYKPISNVSVSVDKKSVYSGDEISYFDSYDYLYSTEAKNAATFTLNGTGYTVNSKSIIVQKDGEINHTELTLNVDNQYILNDNVILELIQTDNEYSLVVYSFPWGCPATISVKFVLFDATGTEMPKFASVRINDVTRISNISAQEYDNQDMIFWGTGKENNLTLTYSSNATTLTEEILIFQKDADGNFIDKKEGENPYKELLISSDTIKDYGYPAIVYKNGLTLTSQDVGSGYLYIVPKDNIKSFNEDSGFEFYDDRQNKTIAINIGDGSNETNAFVITSAQQMINLDPNYYYKLGNNITLDNRFVTLDEFGKTFDGNGYTITINNISPNDSNDYALFSVLADGGTIKNLNIVANYNINTSEAINLGGIVVTNNGTITNCKVIANYNITCSSASNIGGVVATNNGNITGTYAESSEITFGTDNFDINLNVTINGTITFGGVAASNIGTIQNMSVGGKIDYSSATAVEPISDNADTNNYYFVTINGVKQISHDITDTDFVLSCGSELSQNTNGDYFIAIDSSNKEYALTSLLNIDPVNKNNTRYNAVLGEGSNIALIDGGDIKIFGTGKIVINVNSIYDENTIKSITIYVINQVSNFGIYKDANLGSEINQLSFYVASGYGSIYLNATDTNGASIPSSQLMVKFASNNATVVNTTIDNNRWSLQDGTYYIMLPYKNVYSIESTTKLTTAITVNLYYNVNSSVANNVIGSENLNIDVKTGASELAFANNKNSATISQRSTYELVVSAKTDDQYDVIIVSYDKTDTNLSVNFLSNGIYDSENEVLSKTFYITYNQDEPIKEDISFDLLFQTLSNNELAKNFTITITPQAVESVDSAFFGMHKKDPNEKEGDWLYINPSNVQVDSADARWGLLEYYVYPHYANYDYFIIESNNEYLQMDAIKLSSTTESGYELDISSYEKLSNNAIKVYYRAGYFDNGVSENDPTYSFRQLYNIRLMIDNRAEHMQEITLTTRFFKNDGTEYVIKDNKPITLYAVKDSVLEVSLQDQSLMYGSGDNATAYIPFGTQEALSINASEFDNNVNWNIYTKNGEGAEVEVYSEVQVVLNNGVYQLIVDDDMDTIGKEYTIKFNATKVVYGTQKTYTKELKVLVTLFTVTDITVNNLNNGILTGMTYYNTPLEVKLSLKYDENSYTEPYEITADNTTTNIKKSIDELLSSINYAETKLNDTTSSSIWSYKNIDGYKNITSGETTSIFEVSHVTNELFYLIGKQDNQVTDFKMNVGIGAENGILQYKSENATKTFEKNFKVVFTEQTSIDNAIPVYNQTDFENMEKDKDYILMNDIYLDNYSPISNEIHSFDGNNKTIYITSSTYSDYIQNNNNVKIALFDTVSEDTIIKNVTLRYVNSAEYKIDGAVDIEIPTRTNGIITYSNETFDTSSEYKNYFKQDTADSDRYLYADSIFITLLRNNENSIIGATIDYGTATVQLSHEQLEDLTITRISEEYKIKGVTYHYFIIKYSDQTIYYNNTVNNQTNGIVTYNDGTFDDSLENDEYFNQDTADSNRYLYADSIFITLLRDNGNNIIGATIDYGTATVQLSHEQLEGLTITRISEEYKIKGVTYHYFIIKYSDQTIYYNNTVTNSENNGNSNIIENTDSQPNENNYTQSSVIADTNTCIITFNNDVTEISFAGIAVVNNGTITNAKIYGKVNLDYLETSTVPTTYNAGLVVTNNGYITNSAVGTQKYGFEFTGTGQLAGFVWTNSESGKISSSYVDNIYLIRKYSAKEGDGTAGFVYVNNGTINSCYTRGANTENNSSIMYNDGGISAIGIASAFVFTNNKEINDCYTNIKIFASGSACGFVYRNETNGIITNSYSISMLNGSSSSNTPFEGVSIESGEIAYNNGTIEYCYYLEGSAVHTNGTSATRLTTSQFAKIDSFPTFNINQYADDSTPYVWEMVEGSPKLVATMTDTISERELVSKSKNYSSIVDFPYLKSVDNESNIETWYNGIEELTIYKSLDNSVLSALYNGKVISTSDIERVSQQLNVQEVEGNPNAYTLSFNDKILNIAINDLVITIQEQGSTSNIPVSGSGNTYDFAYQNITFTLITNNNSKPTVSYNYYRLAVVDNVIYNYRYIDYALGTKENPFIIYDATSYNAYIEGYNYIDNGVKIYGNNNNQKGYYRLIKDIDVYQQFVTTSNKIFAGIFDGNNMQISNVAIINNPDIGVHENVDGFGLFANTQNAIIKNLYVSIAEVASSKHVYVGGVIGKMSGGNLSNIHVNIAEDRNGIVMGTNIVGGVVGYATKDGNDIRLYNIYSSVKVNSTLFTDSTNNKIKYLVVNDKYSNFDEVSYAGAILGAINGNSITDNQNHAQNLYVTAPSTVSGRTAGGVIGIVLKDTKVKNINLEVSSEDQFVRATYYMGGLIGENRGYVDIAEATYSQKIVDAINTAQVAQTPTSIYDEYFRSPSSSETYETTVAMGGLIGLNIGGSLTNANAMVSVRNTTTQFAGGAIGRVVGYGNISKVVASNTVKSNIIMGGLIGSVMSFESFTNLLVSDKKITDTDTTLVAWLKSKYNENEYNYDTQYNTINSDLSINDCKAVGNLRQADTYYLYPQSDINRSYGAFIGLIYYKAEEQADNSMAYEAPTITGSNNHSINTLYNVVNPNYNNEQYFFVPLAYYSSLYSGVSSRLLDGAIINDDDFANIVDGSDKDPITLKVEGVKHHEILKGVTKDEVNENDSKQYKVDIIYINDSYKFTTGSNTQYARVIVKNVNTGAECVYIDGVKYPNNDYSVKFTYNGQEGNINNVTNVTITAKDDITEIANTKSKYYSGFGAPQWVLNSTDGNENNYYTLVKNVAIENWKDYATTPKIDDDIYQISNAQELAWLINNPSKSAILTADIDLSGRYWKPIDNYTGTFDGNGKTIRYATVNSLGNSGSNYDYAGIFGQVSGTVKNLTTEYGTIEGKIAGGVVGHLNGGTLTNITNNNQVIATSILGGVVGNITSGTATSLVNNGTISLNQTGNATYYVGGVVGKSAIDLSGHKNNGAINVQVDNRYATLYVGGVVGNAEGKDVNGCTSQNGRITISTNANLYAGGVVGYVTTINGTNTTGNYSDMYISFNRQYYDSDTPKLNVGGVAGRAITSVNKAFNVGNINLNLQYNVFSNLDIKAGGIVGEIENQSINSESNPIISESYNVGNINVYNAITSNTIYVGGITAYLSGEKIKIDSCYNMGAITADRNNIFIGGLLGRIDSGTVSNSYNNGKVSLTYVDYEIKDGSSTKYNNGLGSLAGYIKSGDTLGDTLFNNSHWTLDSIDYDYGAGLVLDSENKGNKSSIPYSTLSKIQTDLNIEKFEQVVASWYPTLINNKSQLMWKNYTSSFTYQNGAFIISTPEELAYLSSQVKGGNLITEGVIFRLTNDLDMSNRYFTPIGTQTNPFKGTFEGNNYSIKNLTISASIDDTISNIGLFGYTQNANITGISIVNNYYEDNVNNNYEDNEESVTTIIGGIIAVMDGGQLSNSFVEKTNSAHKNFNRNNNKTILGGLVGKISGQSTIDTTYANYVMKLKETTKISNVGSFVGAVDTDANVTISNSYLTQGVGVVIDGKYNTPDLVVNSSGEVILHNVFMFKKQGVSPDTPSYQAIVYENNNKKILTDEVDLQNREGWDYTNIWTFDEYTMNGTYPSLRGLGQNWAEQLVDVVVETDNVYGVEGTATKHSGYIISSAENLAYIMQNINNGVIDTRGKYFVLEKDGEDEEDVDINLSGKYWTPIGTNEYPFEGIFDFNGHSISNMVIDSKNADYAGLFGNVVSYNGDNVAKIMDSKNNIASSTPINNLDNAFVKNTMTDDKISYVGGLAGKVTNANIDNIVTDVRVMGLSSSSSYSVNVGGLVGGVINTINSEGVGEITNIRILNTSNKKLVLSEELLSQLEIMYINQEDDTGTVPSYQVVGIGQYLSSNVGGLIGYINGVIKTDENIYMLETNVNVLAYTQQDSNGFANAGGLVGYINGGANIAYAISGKTTNHVTAISTKGTYVGGAVGELSNGTIGSVVNNTTIATNTSEYRYMGGIVGEVNYATVYHLINMGNIMTSNFNNNEIVGSLIGNVTARTTTIEEARLIITKPDVKSWVNTSLSNYSHIGAIQLYLDIQHNISNLDTSETGKINFNSNVFNTTISKFSTAIGGYTFTISTSGVASIKVTSTTGTT